MAVDFIDINHLNLITQEFETKIRLILAQELERVTT